jgi:hypothetical protein
MAKNTSKTKKNGTTGTGTKRNEIVINGRRFDLAKATVAWLTGTMWRGRPRIEALSWRKLAAIHEYTTDAEVRRVIRREARRCGYTPNTILGLHLAD